MRPRPIATAETLTPAELHAGRQRVDCQRRNEVDGCLDVAAAAEWPGFSCRRCDCYEPGPALDLAALLLVLRDGRQFAPPT